jgi:RNA polymerase sigma-B factor
MTRQKGTNVRSLNSELLWKYYRAKQGGLSRRAQEYKKQLLLQNDGLVITIAKRIKDVCPEDREDLIQFGRIGLNKAIERFDPSSGNALSSFAVPYIRGEMLHFLRDHWGGYKVSRRWVETHSKVYALHRKMTTYGRKITADQVAVNLLAASQSPGDRQKAQEKWAEIKQALNRKPLVELEEDVHQVFFGDQSGIKQQEYASLEDCLAQLPEPHYSCIMGRYFSNRSEEAIAKQQNLPLDQVQVILADGLEWLKHRLGDDLSSIA